MCRPFEMPPRAKQERPPPADVMTRFAQDCPSLCTALSEDLEAPLQPSARALAPSKTRTHHQPD